MLAGILLARWSSWLIFFLFLSVLMDQFSDLLQELQSGDLGGKFLNFDSFMGGYNGDTVTPTQFGSELVLVNDTAFFALARLGKPKFVCVSQATATFEVTRGIKYWRQCSLGHAACSWEAVQS